MKEKEIKMIISKNGEEEIFATGKDALFSLLSYSLDYSLYGKKLNYTMKVKKDYYDENGQRYIDIEIKHNDEIGQKMDLKYIYTNIKTYGGRTETHFLKGVLFDL